MRRLTPLVIVAVLWLLPTMSVSSSALAEIIDSSGFDIIVEFDGGLTTSQEAVFSEAEAYWESVITGYKPGIENISGVTITASGKTIDGVGQILAYTSIPSRVLRSTGTRMYILSTSSSMTFDSADLEVMYANGYLDEVVVHEMAHAIGFGILWDANWVYTWGSGQYTGAAALAAHRSEFVGQSSAAYVPVELGGTTGAANGHWDEVEDGAGLTGIVDAEGRDMKYELMTGWLNLPASSLFISQTTIHSFEDIGFTVVVPEPNVLAMLLGMTLVSLIWSYRLPRPSRKAAAASSGG